MNNASSARKASAYLAAAVIGITGSVAIPAAAYAQQDQVAGHAAAHPENIQKPILENGELQWSIKDSFRRYISGPIAQGQWTLDSGVTDVNNAFMWSGGKGNFAGEQGLISLPGSIHFTGHHGILDMTIKNVRLKLDGPHGTIIADVASREFVGTEAAGPMKIYGGVEFAEVDLGLINVTEDRVFAHDAPVTLTEKGAQAFGGFYKPGEALSPLTFSTDRVPEAPKAEDPKVKDPEAEAPQATDAPKKPAPSAPKAGPKAPIPPAEKASTKLAVFSGDLSWGVRESFRKYIKGPIAHGSWTVEGVKDNNGIFAFSNATGFYDPTTKTGQVNYPGTVSFTGHHGILDIKITNVRLQITNGKGSLVADVVSRPFVDTVTKADPKTYKNVVLGDVDLSGATLTSKSVSAKNAPVTLNGAGSEAFGGFYRAGEKMDPLSFTVKLGDPLAKDQGMLDAANSSDQGPQAAPMTSGEAGNDGNGVGNGSVHNGRGVSVQPNSSTPTDPGKVVPQCVPVTVTEPEAQSGAGNVQGKVSAASLDWGLKRSFRHYISGGIAKGSWELSGVSYKNGAYSWTNGSGQFTEGKGSISFPGSIRFTGHKGILNTKMSDIRVDINGTTGVLYATLSSNNTEGKNTDYGNVAFANLDLSGLKVAGGRVSVSGAKATLTKVGADAFANFYEPGQELDPLSFTGSLTGAGDKAAASGAKPKMVTRVKYQGPGCEQLANTGANEPLKITGVGLAILLGGTGAVVAARRFSRSS